ncbi:hypothetical protein [Planococcus salinus]|uniref:Uncharacterized protein n=1 Tax=Planococcus salinus TaxID=1848460 RepID=A0A3M8PBP7_9BACL|nr:hypothetical protein [Planococcus salinus]RNF40761.1 hypothetical protein EEX84_03270 [Planococcus salinus]
MGTILPLIIVAVAIFVGVASKKYYDKPHIVNFSISAMMLLLVIQTFQMQPLNGLGITAIITCSIAFVIQFYLGFRNIRANA